MSTREEKIEADIAEAKALRDKYYNDRQFDLANGVQTELIELQKNLEKERDREFQRNNASESKVFQ